MPDKASLDRQSTFKPGDVLRYLPKGGNHCREATAYVTEHGAVDTFWQPEGDGESHRLREEELRDADLIFNVNDYEALDRYDRSARSRWETYHPDDRARITMQHGLQEVLFIRKGAEPSLETQINNARVEVEEAESGLRSAEWRLERRREDLAKLEAQR